MKKYDQYYSVSLVNRKKHLRKKPSVSFIKPILVLILLFACCAGGYMLSKRAYAAWSASRLGTWSAKEVVLVGAQGALAKQLYAQAQPKLHAPFSTRDSVQLQRQLAQQHPQLRRVTVKRGLLTGKLKITVTYRNPLAQFVLPQGQVRFIDQDGTVYEDKQPDPLRYIPTVELEGIVPQKLSGEMVDIIESTLQLKSQLEYTSLHLNLTNNTVDLLRPDQSIIHFGEAKELRQKAYRAAQIERLAQQNHTAVHELDFSYFEAGKVFLRQKAR